MPRFFSCLSRRFLNVLVAYAVLVCSGAAVIHYSERWNHLVPGSDGWRDRRCERTKFFPRERVFVDEDGDGKRECVVRMQTCGSSASLQLDENAFPWICDEGVWSCPTNEERKEPMQYGRYARYLCVNGDWSLTGFYWWEAPAPTIWQPPRVMYGDPGDPEPIEPPCVGDCTDMDGDGRTWNDIDADGDGFYES